jgi:hypothetical protein
MPNRFAFVLMAAVLCSASVAALAQPAAIPATQAGERSYTKTEAYDFVRSYAASTRQRQLIASWSRPPCIRIDGLAFDQAAEVRARVAEVAKAVGGNVQAAGCQRPDVQIAFTGDPQAALDGAVARDSGLLGDMTGGAKTLKTVTLPIQAWYVTNGVEFAANSSQGLKTLVLYQENNPYSGGPGVYANGGAYQICCVFPPPPEGVDARGPRQFLKIFVTVDLRRTRDKSLGLISDYLTMLALSQPRSLDHCNALPSVTDLFTGPCPGRAAPTGLTPADAAFLTALYAGAGDEYVIVDRMAELPPNTKVAVR